MRNEHRFHWRAIAAVTLPRTRAPSDRAISIGGRVSALAPAGTVSNANANDDDANDNDNDNNHHQHFKNKLLDSQTID